MSEVGDMTRDVIRATEIDRVVLDAVAVREVTKVPKGVCDDDCGGHRGSAHPCTQQGIGDIIQYTRLDWTGQDRIGYDMI